MKPQGSKFNIALYKGASFETINLKDWFLMEAKERAGFDTDLENIGISLSVNGEERLAQLISMGPLNSMLAQLDQAIARLENFEPALLRSGVLDVSDGHYLLLEPTSDGQTVLISLISLSELPISEYFPNGRMSDKLYEYVALNREVLIEKNRHHGAPVNLPFNYEQLIRELLQNKVAGGTIH
jgi:hypothetical protein